MIIKYWKYIAVAGLTMVLTSVFMPPRLKVKEKLVTEVQERVIVRTRIVERPDGTKETIIDERRDTDSRTEMERTADGLPVWSVSLSQSVYGTQGLKPIYTLGVQKRLLWGLSGGLYGRTDTEVGILLSYSF